MDIPENIKIGGKIYQVAVTMMLKSGSMNSSAEIDHGESMIRITPQEDQKKCTDFLHEMVHGILNHLGYTDHDEQLVDGIANTLFAINVDNPDLFTNLR